MERSRALRGACCVLAGVSLFVEFVDGGTVSGLGGLGTVVFAENAYVGRTKASVGSTIFSGDTFGTGRLGSLQVRSGAALLALSGTSSATLEIEEDAPAATLTHGKITFSTSNSKALSVRAATAVFRARADEPTVGSIGILNSNELIVRCSRGALTITVEDDTRVVHEGSAYIVALNVRPTSTVAEAATKRKDQGTPPPPAGKSKFTWYVIAFAAVVPIFALHEALESPDRP